LSKLEKLIVKVACNEMLLFHLYENRLLVYAPLMSIRTSRVEPAAGRRVHRTGNLTADHILRPL